MLAVLALWSGLAAAQDCRGFPADYVGVRLGSSVFPGMFGFPWRVEVGSRLGPIAASFDFERYRMAHNGSVNHGNALRVAYVFGKERVQGCAGLTLRMDYGWVKNADGTGLNARLRSYRVPVWAAVAGAIAGEEETSLWWWGLYGLVPGSMSLEYYDRDATYDGGRAGTFGSNLQTGLTFRFGPFWAGVDVSMFLVRPSTTTLSLSIGAFGWAD